MTITNFRKDGKPFRNHVSLHMVQDTTNENRYVVGLSLDVGKASDEMRALRGLVTSMLPTRIPASLQPKAGAVV